MARAADRQEPRRLEYQTKAKAKKKKERKKLDFKLQ